MGAVTIIVPFWL